MGQEYQVTFHTKLINEFKEFIVKKIYQNCKINAIHTLYGVWLFVSTNITESIFCFIIHIETIESHHLTNLSILNFREHVLSHIQDNITLIKRINYTYRKLYHLSLSEPHSPHLHFRCCPFWLFHPCLLGFSGQPHQVHQLP